MKQLLSMKKMKIIQSALDIYKSIQSEYPNSKEGLDIEKYISSSIK